ncbi:MAG: phosphoribosylglycinamide formyltransferase [Phycisphaeraceae bacterium]|nr:phosphoribosylglycinamide formyltransferase [Phycisphaeraceae bacterium]
MSDHRLSITVCLSGKGRSLENLLGHIHERDLPARISGVIASRPDVGGLEVAQHHGIPARTIISRDYASAQSLGEAVFDQADAWEADMVLLAGYLSLVGLPRRYINRVVNIHPALLPAFGGQGMYGRRVHEAVLNKGCRLSGCTVHFASEEYDAGPIIDQHSCVVEMLDTPVTLAARVFQLECQALPEAIELLAEGRVVESAGRTIILPPAEADSQRTAHSDDDLLSRWLCPGIGQEDAASAAGPGEEALSRPKLERLPAQLREFEPVMARNPLYLRGRWGIAVRQREEKSR